MFVSAKHGSASPRPSVDAGAASRPPLRGPELRTRHTRRSSESASRLGGGVAGPVARPESTSGPDESSESTSGPTSGGPLAGFVQRVDSVHMGRRRRVAWSVQGVRRLRRCWARRGSDRRALGACLSPSAAASWLDGRPSGVSAAGRRRGGGARPLPVWSLICGQCEMAGHRGAGDAGDAASRRQGARSRPGRGRGVMSVGWDSIRRAAGRVMCRMTSVDDDSPALVLCARKLGRGFGVPASAKWAPSHSGLKPGRRRRGSAALRPMGGRWAVARGACCVPRTRYVALPWAIVGSSAK